MQRHSVLVDDILFCVLDLLNSYWESVQSPRILTVISWVISPVISRLLRECSLFMTLKSARYFSALSCVSVWNWYQTRIGRLYCVCCVRSPIMFCSPSGVLFFLLCQLSHARVFTWRHPRNWLWLSDQSWEFQSVLILIIALAAQNIHFIINQTEK